MSDSMVLVIVMSLTLVVTGGAMALTPNLSDPTVPMGVRVPSSRIHDPAVQRAVSRFRRLCLALTVVALLLVIPWHTLGALLLLLFGLMAACMGAFAWTRRDIIAAKREQGWYAGVPVRLVAPIGRETGTPPPVWGLHVPAILVGVVVLVVSAVRYPSLPDPYPTHWNAAGDIDAWAPKSWGTVLFPGLLTLGLAALIAVVASLAARGRLRLTPHLGAWTPSADQQVRVARRVQLLLGVVNLLSVVMTGTTALLAVFEVNAHAVSALNWAFGILLVAVVVGFLVSIVRLRRQSAETLTSRPREGGEAPAGDTRPPTRADADRAEAPDDDALWWGGMFYVNRDAPSLFVPRRAGSGFDLNLGNPWGLGISVITGLYVVGMVAWSFALGI